MIRFCCNESVLTSKSANKMEQVPGDIPQHMYHAFMEANLLRRLPPRPCSPSSSGALGRQPSLTKGDGTRPGTLVRSQAKLGSWESYPKLCRSQHEQCIIASSSSISESWRLHAAWSLHHGDSDQDADLRGSRAYLRPVIGWASRCPASPLTPALPATAAMAMR